MIASIISFMIFGVTIYLIFSEKVNRVVAAIAGASTMVLVGTALGFYSEKKAVEALDLETIGLLFGMMILVALLEPTGFFQYLAILVARISKGRPVRLLVLLCSVTTVLSMFLDNVTTVVLIAPVTILISEILGMNPTPLLMSEALLSNVGGIATLVGDPPNVMIASAAGLTFNDFLTHSLPIIIVVWFVALFLLRYLFKKELAETPTNVKAVLSLNPKAALDDSKTARKVLTVLGIAILLFFFQGLLGISPAVIAMSAAAVGLVWIRPDIHKTWGG
jgi:Na+/H+ antiporter NhaD/arsenite permease-like protein